MRAWQVTSLGEPSDAMEIVDIDEPAVSDGRVIIDVAAVGVGFPDLLQIRGGYQVKPPLPFVPGQEIAGTVSEVGPGVDGVSVGDRVLWMGGGGMAAKVSAPADSLLPIPDDMSFAQAAAFVVNYGTGVFAIENRANLQAGETMLVTAAAGGAGSAAIQIGKALGANVIGLAGGPEKVKKLYELGADAAFDYREVDIVETVREATGGRGVDVVYECVGGDIFQQVRRTVAWDGRILIIGFTSGTIADAPTNHALLKNYSIVGVHWGAWLNRDPGHLRQNWDRIVELFGTGKLDPMMAGSRPFADAPVALAEIGERKTTGKVVIDISN